jgi:hypothetical protein
MIDLSARIVRVEQAPAGTFGVFLLNNQAFAVTLELPWAGNQPQISCIPIGKYTCRRRKSVLVASITKGIWDNTFEVMDVPGRTAVLFHAGNTITDTHGCVLLAQYFGKLRGDRAVLNSGATFNEFMLMTRNVDILPLEIVEAA